MSMRYLGGVISSTPPSINPNGASGVWTLEQQFQAQGSAVWPPLGDPNFENVTLLLHGDGTNGGQNNTFVDGSTNNFTITRNGNTTQGSFSPYGDFWSNYFDGTGDALTTATSAALNIFTSGDFTVELFAFANSFSGDPYLFSTTRGTSPWDGRCAIQFLSTGAVQFYTSNDTPTGQTFSTSNTASLGQWVHVAVCRSGSTTRIFINGVQGFSGTITLTSTSNQRLELGAAFFNNSNYFNGYLSNVRIVKGTALYTANFTPPTAPLTAITNTSLLTCQSNRFRDASTNNFTITRNGDVSVQRFSPFSPSAAYSTATIGGSGYFDGTGDYLTTPSNTALVMGTGQFWFEAWIYMFSAPSTQYIVLGTNDNPANSALTVRIQPSALRVDRHGAVAYDSSAVTWQYNAWQHIAVGRDSGNTLRFFVNGQAVGTRASTTDNFAGNSNAIGLIPIDNTPASAFRGYIASARLLKGECLYTATFTPPASPLTAITNTSLLLNFTNASIFDNAAMADLETVGNAQINTSYKKFGTGSLAFDGSGDYLTTPASPQLNLTSGNFTIEMWVYWSGANASGNIVSKDGVFGVSYNQYVIELNGASKISCSIGSGNGTSSVQTITSNTNLPTNTWTHLAFVKNGTNLSLYQDGVSVASATQTATMIEGNKPLFIGWQNGQTNSFYWNGYIDDLRITKGVARYTASFTPPEAPFPNY